MNVEREYERKEAAFPGAASYVTYTKRTTVAAPALPDDESKNARTIVATVAATVASLFSWPLRRLSPISAATDAQECLES